MGRKHVNNVPLTSFLDEAYRVYDTNRSFSSLNSNCISPGKRPVLVNLKGVQMTDVSGMLSIQGCRCPFIPGTGSVIGFHFDVVVPVYHWTSICPSPMLQILPT